MSKTAETLTQKLHDRSDSKLRARLKEAFYEVRGEFTDGCCHTIKVQGGYVQGGDNSLKQFEVDAHKAWSGLEDLAFNMQYEKCRTDEVNEFLSQVESLFGQIEDLQQSIRQ